MECMAQEAVLFEDIMCQLFDMIKPEDEGYICLNDLKGSKLSGNVFNILFNLNKFMAFETRDPFLIRQVTLDINTFSTSYVLIEMKSLFYYDILLHRSGQILHGPSGIVLLIENTLGYPWKKTSKMLLMEVLKHGMTHSRFLFEVCRAIVATLSNAKQNSRCCF